MHTREEWALAAQEVMTSNLVVVPTAKCRWPAHPYYDYPLSHPASFHPVVLPLAKPELPVPDIRSVPQTPLLPLSVPGKDGSGQEREQITVVLGRLRGVGRVWYAYDATVSVSHMGVPGPTTGLFSGAAKRSAIQPDMKVIAKVWYMSRPLDKAGVDEYGNRRTIYTKSEFYHVLSKEWRAHLALNGQAGVKIVPQHLGLFGSVQRVGMRRVEMVVGLMEDAGIQLEEASTMSLKEQRTILSHYARLHRVGILHVDVAPKQWMRNEDGELTVVDFEGSEFVDQVYGGRAGWAGVTGREVEYVRALFGGLDPYGYAR